MTPPALAPDTLIDLLSRHQVIDADALWQFLAEHGGARGLPADAAAVVADLVGRGQLTGYQGERLLADDVTGLRVGRYWLLAPLGGGAVFLAERRPDGARVAVKVAPAGHTACAERLRREAETLARLDHPGVVTIKDSGSDGGRPFLVTEHVEGQSLAELVRKQGPLAPIQAARIIHDAARVLDHIHIEGGTLHADVRPEHLMLADNGKLRVVGLGRARPMDGCGPRPEVDVPSPYQAPELRGDGPADGRADVYGLGATFHFLLTGEAPGRPLAEAQPGLPDMLGVIVERMTAADPAARPASAGVVARALFDLMHEATTPPPPTRQEPPPPHEDPVTISDLGLTPVDADEPVGRSGTWLPTLLALVAGVAVFLATLAIWNML